MKETYEKPKMATETIEIDLLAAGSARLAIDQLDPYFLLCPPCGVDNR